MNILVLNYEFPPIGGGAAPVSRDLSIAFSRAGHKVTVITMGFKGLPAEEEIEGVRIIRVKCLRKQAHACMPWEQMTFILSAISFLREHLKTNRYDICHTHFVIPTGPVALWLKKYAGIPYVLTAHGSDVEGHNKRNYIRIIHFFIRPFWKQFIRNAYAVTAPSAYLLNLMKKHLDYENYVLIPNGIDRKKYRTLPEEKERRILLMGRMQHHKCFQNFLRAVVRIPDEIWGSWKADFLGEGPYRAKLDMLTDELKLRDRVIFHGWIENGTPEQIGFLKKAAIFVSCSGFENCPMTVIEAMASGCYPLLSDIEGHRQFFANAGDRDKHLFWIGDDKILSEKLTEILPHDPEEIYRKFDISSFDIENVTKDYLELFKEAVKTEER